MNNKPLRLLTIVGARPQFIKAAAVSRAIAQHNQRCQHDQCKPKGQSNQNGQRQHHQSQPDNDQSLQKNTGQINEILVHTGQHFDANMSQVFFDELEIPQPHYNLNINGGTHGYQTGRMLEHIEEVLQKEKPDCVMVYGDTNSTLAGSLAAVKLHIPVAHVEAGLRSFNRAMPEEINRVLTDHISTRLFCPTQTAVDNLKNEGISQGVSLTGDVMYDCALFYKQKSRIKEQALFSRLNIEPCKYMLATIHRAENTNDISRLNDIFLAFNDIATSIQPIILPLHPRTKKIISQHNLNISENIKIIPPVTYLEMIALESNATVILTDSGGVQKEAYFFHVPCVTLRNETEWVETLDHNCNCLAGANCNNIITSVQNQIKDAPNQWPAHYGTGNASNVICQLLLQD